MAAIVFSVQLPLRVVAKVVQVMVSQISTQVQVDLVEVVDPGRTREWEPVGYPDRVTVVVMARVIPVGALVEPVVEQGG